MSSSRNYKLMCDCRGCAASFDGVERLDLTRHLARDHGWASGVRLNPKGRMAESVDYCPEHHELIGELKPRYMSALARPVEDA